VEVRGAALVWVVSDRSWSRDRRRVKWVMVWVMLNISRFEGPFDFTVV